MRLSWLHVLLRNFREFWNCEYYEASRQNLFANFVDLTHSAHLPWLILQPSVDSTTIFYESSFEPLASSTEHIHREKFSWISAKKFLNNNIYIRLAAITINYHDGNSAYNLLLSGAFSVGIPLTVGFRPQLVVVSGLSVGIPLTVGFRLSRSLKLSQSLSQTLSLFSIWLWLSRSHPHEIFLFFTMISFFFHDGILAIKKSFSRNFFFFFHDGILAVKKPFSRIFLSHGGILAITELFHKFFFHMVESRLSRILFTNFSFTW
jgi:hypothetical protein